jgi:RNA-directed DNA polymerase
LILDYYAYALNKKYESYIEQEGFLECVLAYRSNLGGKANIQFSKEVFDYVKAKGTCSAVALDIKGYFDHINHKLLKESWQKVIGGALPEDQYRIYRILTGYSYINKFSFLRKYNQDFRKLKKEARKDAKVSLPKTLLDCLLPRKKDYDKFKQLKQDSLIVTNRKNDRVTGHYGIPQGSSLSALLSNIYLIDFDKVLCQKAQNEGFLYRR